MPEAFKFLPVAKDEGLIGLHPVRGSAHQVQDRWCSGIQPCAEADGAIAQQEAMHDDSGNSGDGERDCGGSEDSEIIRKGTGTVGNGSGTGGLVQEQGRIRESTECQEELLEELASNT